MRFGVAHVAPGPRAGREAQRGLLRAELLRHLAHDLHFLLHALVDPTKHCRRVGSHGDTPRFRRRGREALVELLCEVRQQWVHQPHGPVQADVKHLAGDGTVLLQTPLLLVAGALLCIAVEPGLQELEVDVAEVVEEEGVSRGGGAGELVLLPRLVRHLGAVAQPRQYPTVLPRKRRVQPQRAGKLEVVPEVPQAEACGVPDLVAEVAVAHDAVDVQVHVPALLRVSEEAEAQGVGAALGDAIGVVRGLPLLRPLHLLGRQIALLQLLVQLLQADAVDHLDGIDDVAQALGHLPAMGVAHECMEVDGLERQLARQPDGHHHHPGHPEEQDVVTRLQKRRGEKGLEVVVALRVGPTEHREGEKSRGEPCV
mmetsp:Transcript_100323/g.281116  ORF Transcript_100323/g.281116 Transcript_100323/m.281116 type:complete len:369 (+) Transcript_100323:468-1574(+)